MLFEVKVFVMLCMVYRLVFLFIRTSNFAAEAETKVYVLIFFYVLSLKRS